MYFTVLVIFYIDLKYLLGGTHTYHLLSSLEPCKYAGASGSIMICDPDRYTDHMLLLRARVGQCLPPRRRQPDAAPTEIVVGIRVKTHPDGETHSHQHVSRAPKFPSVPFILHFAPHLASTQSTGITPTTHM